MAGTWATLVILDGGGTSRTMRVWDESGIGNGPFSFGQYTVASDGSGNIASGGVAQNLFSGTTPANGFTVHNPDSTEDLWISLSTTALANGQGSINVAAGGGSYTTPLGLKPFHSISIVATTTGHKFTAVSW